MWVCVCFCEPILSIFNEFHCQLCIQLCWPRPGLLKVRTPVRIRTGREFNPDPPPPDISSARVSLRPPCGARGTHTHTHTHTHGCMNQCCRDYRLFCKTKHIATSEILDKPQIPFSRIMSPVSPRKPPPPPPRLSPPAELAAYSKNRTAADFWMNKYKTAFPKTYHSWLSGIWTWM